MKKSTLSGELAAAGLVLALTAALWFVLSIWDTHKPAAARSWRDRPEYNRVVRNHRAGPNRQRLRRVSIHSCSRASAWP